VKPQQAAGCRPSVCIIICHLCDLEEAIISHGCTVQRSDISNAVVGLRSHIEEGCTIEVSLVLPPLSPLLHQRTPGTRCASHCWLLHVT